MGPYYSSFEPQLRRQVREGKSFPSLLLLVIQILYTFFLHIALCYTFFSTVFNVFVRRKNPKTYEKPHFVNQLCAYQKLLMLSNVVEGLIELILVFHSRYLLAILHIIFSTLEKENGTFVNACEVCPHATKVEVGQMTPEDAQEMVSKTLEKYNKKLTTDDDPLLGNQMKILLAKSLSPLYLNSTIQALRRFGIFEKLSQYISNLPGDIRELFSFLLGELASKVSTLRTF